MNIYVERYIKRRHEGFNHLEAYAIVASGIAVGGTMEDLKAVDRTFQRDLDKKVEGLINEPITRSVSAV